MQKFISILLALVMALMASGYPQAVHLRMHAEEDAREEMAAASLAQPDPGKPVAPAHHGHEDCPICASFQAPVTFVSYAIVLIDTGAWVRHVAMPALSQQAQTIPQRTSCRGPPASASC